MGNCTSVQRLRPVCSEGSSFNWSHSLIYKIRIRSVNKMDVSLQNIVYQMGGAVLFYLSDNSSSDSWSHISEHESPQFFIIFIKLQSHWSLCLNLHHCILSFAQTSVEHWNHIYSALKVQKNKSPRIQHNYDVIYCCMTSPFKILIFLWAIFVLL